jgi:hypothetical protein
MSLDTFNSALSGLCAGTLQMSSLLWLRTINKTQYKYGTGFTQTFKNLYKEGKFYRLYRGYIPTVIDNSLCRFGDAYVYYYINKHYPDEVTYKKSYLMSLYTIPHKFILTPLDTISANYHVYGDQGKTILKNTLKEHGIKGLYAGGSQIIFLNFFSNYIWFSSFLYLEEITKNYRRDSHFINGLNGFIPTVISDIFTNPFRMIKTYKQTSNGLSYRDCITEIFNQSSSLTNILFRGLNSRIISHGLQSGVYVMLWKALEKN